MFCPNCGASVPDNAKFCGKCGARLDDDIQGEAPQEPTHDDVPALRQPRQVQIVRPVQSSDTEADIEPEIVKPKKKMPLKLIGGFIAAAILIAAGFFAVTHFTATPSEAYIVISDGHYKLFTDLKDPELIELASYKSDDSPAASLVRFDPAKKYVYFITKFDRDDLTGTLCRAEWKKLKKDSNKNDEYIETIASNVSTKTRNFNFFDNGNFCYVNSDDTLYYYNGEESVRVAKSVYSFGTDDKGRILYRVKNDDGEYTLYGTSIDDIDNKVKLASSVYAVCDSSDFDNILYVKETKDGEKYLYTIGFEKDAEKILEDDITDVVSQSLVKNQSADDASGHIVVANSGDKIDWDDYFASGTDEYTKELVSYALLSELGASDEDELKDIYFYNNGKLTLLVEDVLYVDLGCDGGVLYIAANDADTLDFSDYTDLGKVVTETQEYIYEHMNVIVTSSETPEICTFSTDAIETIVEAANNGELHLIIFFDDRVYLDESDDISGVISVADIKENEIGNFKLLSDDASIMKVIGNKLYYEEAYYSDSDGEYADIYSYDGENKTRIAKEASNIELYDDGNILVYCDDGIYILNAAGESTWLADEAYPIYNLDGTQYLYVSDEDAYIFDGKDNKMITSDAEYVWSSKHVSSTAYL